jgi:hypothetical protein
VAGALKAAEVLRPNGRVAIFGHVFEPPPEVAEPFAAAFRTVVPDSPFSNQPARRPVEMYQAMYAKVADSLRQPWWPWSMFHLFMSLACVDDTTRGNFLPDSLASLRCFFGGPAEKLAAACPAKGDVYIDAPIGVNGR